MTADVAELVIRLRADTDKLQAEMRKATSTVQQSSNKMQSSLGGIAAAARTLLPALGVGAFINFAKNAAFAADRLNDLSARTGVAATTFSALDLPLKLAGSSTEEFASSLNRMNNAIGEAASGQSEAAIKTFSDLGLSIQSLMALSPEQQFQAIATALNGITNQAEFTNKGMAIFGRQFASLSPIIRQANGDIETLVKNQQELGNSFTEQELKMVGDFYDAIDIGVKKAEISVIRLISAIVNLRTNMVKLAEPTAGSTDKDIDAIDKEIARKRAGIDLAQSRAGSSPEFARKAIERNQQEIQRLEIDRGALQMQKRRLETVRYGEEFGPAQRSQANRPAAVIAQTKAVKEASVAVEQQTAQIEEFNKVTEAANKRTEQFANTIRDRLSQGLTDIIFTADSAGDAFKSLGMQIARSVFEASVARPFADGITSAVSGSGIFSSIGDFIGNNLPSFDVGSANIPRDMIAQIHKGERIVPANQNNPRGMAALSGGGGGSVTVNQYFQTGVSRAELQSVLPQVAAAAHDAVFASIQKGGSAAKIVGAR